MARKNVNHLLHYHSNKSFSSDRVGSVIKSGNCFRVNCIRWSQADNLYIIDR